MLQATHSITIGSDCYASPANSRLTWLEQSSGMDTLVNVCSLIMAPADGLDINPGDDIEVELGNGDTSGVVFTGKIETVDWQIGEVHVEAACSSKLLVLARYNMYFEQSTAGSIVSNLCSEAGVTTGQVDDGLTFEYYAVGSNQNAADHIMVLAQICGLDAYSDETDQLVFASPIPQNPHLLQYGINILTASIRIPDDGFGTTELFGEGAASFGQGSSGATWFTKNEVNGTASSGQGMTLPVVNPAIRTITDANDVASNYHNAFKSKINGQVIIIGNPDIKVGNSVEISAMPLASQNGLYKVTGIKHRVTKRKGFVTQLIIEEL